MLRFLIADDHAIVLQGIRQLILGRYPNAEIVDVHDAKSLLIKVEQEDWSLVISDVNMPDKNGLDALKDIKKSKPQIPVLIMSMYPETKFGLRAFKAGASGYLGKDIIHEELLVAIGKVLDGRKYVTMAIAEQLSGVLNQDQTLELHQTLSDREFEVFKMLADGKSVSQIAAILKLNPTTISTFRARIMEKMNMRSNPELTKYAIENNLI